MTSHPVSPQRVELLGLPLDLVDMAEAVSRVEQWVDTGGRGVAVGVNAHMVNLCAGDPNFAAKVRNSDLLYPDGQAVVWASRLLGHPAPHRVATTDLIYPLAAMCARRGFSMFFFGARPGVADRAARRLSSRFAGLRIDTHHGYIDDTDMPNVLERIERSAPAVLLVGLGDPLQQEWVARYRSAVSAPAILTCGGLFDWISGDRRRPPNWLVRAGLEWAWRLLMEPRRLAGRYLLGNPAFVWRVVMEKARGVTVNRVG